MIPKFQVNDVVQFTENHKWCGCYGTITDIKDCGEDIRYLIGVTVPTNDNEPCPTAYIFSMESGNLFEYVGKAIMVSDHE